MLNWEIDDIITQDGFLDFCNKNKISFIKTDFLYRGHKFLWRGNEHPSDINKISVIGHSDYPVTDNIVNDFEKVFTINRLTNNPKVFGIPLGITSDCDDSPLHRIYGNKEIMFDVFNKPIEKTKFVYINFDINTNVNIRKPIYDKFKNYDWVTVGVNNQTLEGRKQYLIDIKSSKFIFCPEGNGVDTHRIWESLYMGSIPIVIYKDTHHLFTDLPILFINSWNEINYEFLEEKYKEITSEKWSYNKLKMSYWENFIKNEILK